ncbi:winged helix-turn-helix domain-containing protein, partial [Vibrio campbellii]|uniref:winged helix-turn-helix domain-containing protein n=2 Tax=Vibrio TaxID=662 RepID=UPI003D0F52E6
ISHDADNLTRPPSTESDPNSLDLGRLVINISHRTVYLDNKIIDLSTAEFELLYLLARTPGQVVSRDIIVQQIRGYDYDGLDRSIDRRISRLRKKLLDDPVRPNLIKTVRGKGYQLCIHFCGY